MSGEGFELTYDPNTFRWHDIPACNVIESPSGPLLVYEWARGELLRSEKENPASPLHRFHRLPIEHLLIAINTIYDVLDQISDAGWITEDFYDGSVIYDVDSMVLHIIDLAHRHRGPFINTSGMMFGSSRFMAPEEFQKGALIDHRTASFLMGRIAAVFLSDNSLDPNPFRGSDRQYEVIIKACKETPENRYQSEAEFLKGWRIASNAR